MRGPGALVALGVAILLVAGCSKAGPEREPEITENVVEPAPEPAPPPRAEVEKPLPQVAEPVINSVEALPPEEDPSREAQMAEDADATGMTARASRDSSETSNDPIGDLVENGGTIAH